MEKSGKRGKIPQSDWPLIMARYEQGETLSSIARTYDCSPPAISYIVSRSREKTTGEIAPPAATEPLLVKAQANGADGDGSADVEPTVAPPAAALVRRDAVAEPRPATPITAAAPPAAPIVTAPADNAAVNGDQRRTLHLALGNGNGSANGNGSNGNGGHAHAPRNGNGHNTDTPARPSFEVPRSMQPQVANNGNGATNGQRPFQAPRNPPAFDAGRGARDLFALPEGRPAAQQPRDADVARNGNGNFIDQELRSRVDGDIAAFLAAFDAALASDTHESRFGLREATDRLLRAGARTRIELERLEARVPLTPRDGKAEPEPAGWRYR
jgi:hypothetical protein